MFLLLPAYASFPATAAGTLVKSFSPRTVQIKGTQVRSGNWKCEALLRASVTLVFSILAATSGWAQTPRDLTGIVTAVPSGDEIEIDGTRIRLQGIAAPGRYMPFGGDAAAFMQFLVMEKEVTCRLTGERTRGREVGTCEWNGVDIASVIVREGLARDCPRFSQGRYANDEREAKQTGLLEAYPLPDYCGSGV